MIKKIIVTLILTIVFANLIIFAPLWNISFNKEFYLNEFERYDVYSRMPYGSDVIDREFFNTLDYVKGKNEYQTNFFNQKERQHFEDVRSIFSFIKNIMLISILIILLFINFLKKEDLEQFLDGVMNGSILSLLFTFFIGIASMFNFNKVFVKMHEVIFANNLWKMDYINDKIIRLLPQYLFLDLAVRWLIVVFLVSVFFISTVFIVKRYAPLIHKSYK